MRKAILFFLLFTCLLVGCAKKQPEIPTAPPETPPTASPASVQTVVRHTEASAAIPENRSPLTGLELEQPYQPVAILVENFAAARPHSGVIDADIVYEAHMEGGITRFLAIFQSKSPEVVGPVRSLRHYFMWIGLEWDALLVHYGQSSIAEDKFTQIPVRRLNGIVSGRPFWRDTSRRAPHNVYVAVNSCRERIDFKQQVQGFAFEDSRSWEGTPYRRIRIPYSRSSNLVEYTYNPADRLHYRFINGREDVDRETGKQLFARNIIVQYAHHSVLEPGAGYRDVALIGSGRARFFIDGHTREGTWERPDQEMRTIFYDAQMEEIKLLPGNTWVQVVQTEMQVTFE